MSIYQNVGVYVGMGLYKSMGFCARLYGSRKTPAAKQAENKFTAHGAQPLSMYTAHSSGEPESSQACAPGGNLSEVTSSVGRLLKKSKELGTMHKSKSETSPEAVDSRIESLPPL
jgi:hypothetical protein